METASQYFHGRVAMHMNISRSSSIVNKSGTSDESTLFFVCRDMPGISAKMVDIINYSLFFSSLSSIHSYLDEHGNRGHCYQPLGMLF
jgi:hypothetical protein